MDALDTIYNSIEDVSTNCTQANMAIVSTFHAFHTENKG